MAALSVEILFLAINSKVPGEAFCSGHHVLPRAGIRQPIQQQGVGF